MSNYCFMVLNLFKPDKNNCLTKTWYSCTNDPGSWAGADYMTALCLENDSSVEQLEDIEQAHVIYLHNLSTNQIEQLYDIQDVEKHYAAVLKLCEKHNCHQFVYGPGLSREVDTYKSGTVSGYSGYDVHILQEDDDIDISKLEETYSGIIKYLNNTQIYYQNGKIHREDGPAIIYEDGDVKYYLNGQQLENDIIDELINNGCNMKEAIKQTYNTNKQTAN